MKALFTRRQTASLLVGSVFLFVLTTGYAKDPEAIVREIRARYDQIEGAKLRPREIEFTSNRDPVTGTFTRYYEGDALVKIKLSYEMGDHGGSVEYFYYDQGKLFFAFGTDSAWSFSGETLPNGEGGTLDVAIEHRVYLADEVPMRHLSREAKSKDPAALTSLLKKAPNVPGQDRERLERLIAVGKGVRRAATGEAVLKVLLP